MPEPPKLADFDQSLQDYKAQVQTEIAQEAAAAGMTVEEYAAAGFEAPQQDSFSIYQLRNEDSTRDYRFEPYDRLQAAGRTVDKANYTEVYAVSSQCPCVCLPESPDAAEYAIRDKISGGMLWKLRL